MVRDEHVWSHNPTHLDLLLRGIQRRDRPQILSNFHQWTTSLVDTDNAAALDELAQLPIPTFSEILRWIDPVENSSHDVAHGLGISIGQLQFTNADWLVDDYGVRAQHRAVLKAMKILVEARLECGKPLMVVDYQVLMRCAGAAADLAAAADFFGAIAKNGLQARRNTATWTEFMKARFMVEPIYYQYDRSRVAVMASQTYTAHERCVQADFWRMERMRLSINALRALPFNRRPERPSQDLRMWLRNKTGFKSARAHWIRSKLYGVLLDEEMLCTTMVAFARASSMVGIRGVVLQRGFRISLFENSKTGEISIAGGKRFRPGSPREPTERFLNAIVESFGSMSRVNTGLKLLVYVSQRYSIPIPHKTWSNLLNWAYVCASKPFQPQRRLQGRWPLNVVGPKDIRKIWSIMTSKPYEVEPAFDDYGVYVKALVITRCFFSALDVIRDYAIPYYRRLEQEHQQIVSDDILQGVSTPSHRRTEIEVRKEYVWFHIASWVTKIVRTASKNKKQRQGRFMKVILPNLIIEFDEFLHDQIRYRTAQGHVCLNRPVVDKRFDWVREFRDVLPADAGGIMIRRKLEELEVNTRDSDFVWPQVIPMKVLEWRRKPRQRERALGLAPESTDVKAREWWKNLEDELMT